MVSFLPVVVAIFMLTLTSASRHKLYRYNYQQHCYSDQYSPGHCHPSTIVAVKILPIIIIIIIIIMKEMKSR